MTGSAGGDQCGGEPWDTSLVAFTTSHYDERFGPPPNYVISSYNPWYYFMAFGEN